MTESVIVIRHDLEAFVIPEWVATHLGINRENEKAIREAIDAIRGSKGAGMPERLRGHDTSGQDGAR